MQENQEKGLNRRKFFRVVVVFICLVAAISLGTIFVHQERTMKVQREQLKQLEQSLQELKENNDLLREEISYMDSDAYIERMAREKLGMIRKGETVYVDDDTDQQGNKD